jgi:hypothetical protein
MPKKIHETTHVNETAIAIETTHANANETAHANDIKSLIELNKKMYKELKEQKKMIENLEKEHIKIVDNTEKMCNHINFINNTYDNIKNGYFFKSLFK